MPPTGAAASTTVAPPHLHIRTDPHAGRKYHASAALAAGTDLLGRCAPYSCTIWKRFRHEVCAECWRYDGGRRAFLTRRDDEREPGGDGRSAKGAGAGLWFCDGCCQEAWLEREGADVVDLLRELEAARQKKAKAKTDAEPSGEITEEAVERAWGAVRARERAPKEVRRWAGLQLEDYEADMARYVLLALHRCLREQSSGDAQEAARSQLPSASTAGSDGLVRPTTAANGFSSSSGKPRTEWETFASLQSNELELLKACPEILEHQTRIYQLLRGRFGPRSVASPGASSRSSSLADLITVENVRTVLGVDPGNAFGIWEMPLMEESECLGFAVYPVASFFNHHCAPNVRKEREGRTLRFVTTREVGAGEELCISYGHVENMSRQARQEELLEGWYFECRCSRCEAEREPSTGGDRTLET
ncbi:hypothetical protein BD413DRAFT_483458 [Trametes elegans]|nr:hypothetical protein BD413DRAFT_483458 [Trametes elegans]